MPQHRDHAKHVSYFYAQEFSLGDDNAYRWDTSNNVVPDDIVSSWAYEGLIGLAVLAKHKKAAEADLAKFLAGYRKAQAARTPEQLAEEAAEMRAAFGPGQKIVNIVTGQMTQT